MLDGKIAAWGDFEWRTDAVNFPNMAADKSFRQDVQRFLDAHPHSSFHTCCGGSTYAHLFEIGGRYASYNMLSDLGRGPYVNHYFSYLEPPDRWGDIIDSLLMARAQATRGDAAAKPEDLRHMKENSRGMLTGVPSPYWGPLSAAEGEIARRDMDLYRFLRHEGLAGRWSYVFHPAVQGDQPYYYFQRTSHDRRKACILLTHRAEHPLVVCPRGLLPEARYTVGFDSTPAATERTGADLMTAGIAIQEQQPGELIYLNLPNRPGSGKDKIPPQAPGRVLAGRENNIGHGGIGIHWSPVPITTGSATTKCGATEPSSTRSPSETTTLIMPLSAAPSRVRRANGGRRWQLQRLDRRGADGRRAVGVRIVGRPLQPVGPRRLERRDHRG